MDGFWKRQATFQQNKNRSKRQNLQADSGCHNQRHSTGYGIHNRNLSISAHFSLQDKYIGGVSDAAVIISKLIYKLLRRYIASLLGLKILQFWQAENAICENCLRRGKAYEKRYSSHRLSAFDWLPDPGHRSIVGLFPQRQRPSRHPNYGIPDFFLPPG